MYAEIAGRVWRSLPGAGRPFSPCIGSEDAPAGENPCGEKLEGLQFLCQSCPHQRIGGPKPQPAKILFLLVSVSADFIAGGPANRGRCPLARPAPIFRPPAAPIQPISAGAESHEIIFGKYFSPGWWGDDSAGPSFPADLAAARRASQGGARLPIDRMRIESALRNCKIPPWPLATEENISCGFYEDCLASWS